VTGDELPDALPDALPVSDAARIAFLIQPFNARRLLDAVSRLVDGRAAGEHRHGDLPEAVARTWTTAVDP